MIAIDSSSLIAYFSGDEGPDTEIIDKAFISNLAVLPPIVVTELLSDYKLGKEEKGTIKAIPVMEIMDGFWERAGLMRAKLVAKKLRGNIADTLIAQFCLDHDVKLLTRDKDFRHFSEYCGLKLYKIANN